MEDGGVEREREREREQCRIQADSAVVVVQRTDQQAASTTGEQPPFVFSPSPLQWGSAFTVAPDGVGEAKKYPPISR